MNKREYHYLISGLPAISPGEKMWTTVPAFREHLEAHLHPEDFAQVRHVLLQKDHQNLLRYLETGEIAEGTGGNFSVADFKDIGDGMESMDLGKPVMPEYMADILATTGDAERPAEKAVLQRKMDEGFLGYIQENGNDFLRTYYGFLYDLDNLLTFLKAGEYKMDQQEQITGNTGHAQFLKEYAGRNLVKDPEFEYFEEILSLAENPSFAEREKNIDQLKWRVIDDLNLYEYFSVDRVLGYLLQMLIAERWSKLDAAAGEASLGKIMDLSYRRINEKKLMNQQ